MTHLRLLVLVLLVLVISGTTPAAGADTTNSTQEERQFMDKAANTMLVSRTLNTLTTTCGGGCGADSPCVIVGSSSENRINCVNETRCTTFTNGMTALCMAPFNDNSDVWGFYPAKTNDTTGIAPFERVGLVQPSDGVRHVLFRRADDQFGPLNSALDVSSFNLQPPTVISSLLFDGIQLSGASDALPINSSLQLGIVNCQLKSIPTQMIMGSNIRELDLSRNAIATADSLRGVIFPSLAKFNLQYNQLASMELTAATFPMLEALELDFNNFPTIPEFIFDVPTLRNLSLTSNPVNASLLSDKQFEFLAQLETFAIDGVTPTEACPSDETIARLNSSFTFCINQVGSGSGSGSGSGTNVGDVELTPTPTTVVGESSGSSGSKAGLVVGIVVGVLALMAILAFVLWYCKRRRDKNRDTDPHKPTFTSMGSFIANGHALSKGRVVDDFTGDGGHYDAYVPLRSNPSSEQSSDSYPILGNISNDGPDGLSRLSYQDLYLHKLLRVSSRSELWLGEYFDETVVVKKIKVNTVSRAVMRDFVEEVKLMSTLKHPRIVEFRGALWDKSGTELCAVVEYIANGPLRNVTSSTQQNLSVPKQHAIARQIAEALAFLHSQTIVHGRLNAFNILLDQDYSAKLSLFSIFHYVRLSPLDYECAVFVAPEVQRGQQPTEKADVFAFGVVLVELNTEESPEQNRRRRASLQDSSPEANSPTAQRTGFTLSPQCSSMMKDLITACVERDPARRPSMAQIAMALRSTEVTM